MTNKCNSVNHTHLIFRSVKAATEAWIAQEDESEEEEIDGEEEDIDVDQIGRLSRRFSSYFSQQIHVININNSNTPELNIRNGTAGTLMAVLAQI